MTRQTRRRLRWLVAGLLLPIGATSLTGLAALAGASATTAPAAERFAVAARWRAGSTPYAAVDAGRGVWAADYAGGSVLEIDPTTGRTVARIPVGAGATALAVADGGRRLVVGRTWFDARSVVIVDTRAGRVTASVPVGFEPDLLASNGGGVVLVGGEASATVVEIDPATGRVVRRLRLPLVPLALALRRDGEIVAVGRGGIIAEVAPTGRVLRRLHVPGHPVGLAVRSGVAWVVGDGGHLDRISLSTAQVERVALPSAHRLAAGLAAAASRLLPPLSVAALTSDRAVVADALAGQVVIVGASGAVGQTVHIATPYGVDATPSGSVLIADPGAGRVIELVPAEAAGKGGEG